MPQGAFHKEFFLLLEETFETHHGIYLDKGTSLFETLDQISAVDASIPIGDQCATIAAQVEHVIFYLDVLEMVINGQEFGDVDWGEVWRRVSEVSSAEWHTIRTRLKDAYDRVTAKLHTIDDWQQNEAIGASMAIVVHTAYHLGEIRQALCTLE